MQSAPDTSRRQSFTAADRGVQQMASFSAAMAHWELTARSVEQLSAGLKPSTWPCHGTVLMVDISGFTSLCSKLSVDSLQMYINRHLTSVGLSLSCVLPQYHIATEETTRGQANSPSDATARHTISATANTYDRQSTPSQTALY